jgi:hypothetical protein
VRGWMVATYRGSPSKALLRHACCRECRKSEAGVQPGANPIAHRGRDWMYSVRRPYLGYGGPIVLYKARAPGDGHLLAGPRIGPFGLPACFSFAVGSFLEPAGAFYPGMVPRSLI